ncbi:hypothetical protein [Nocardia sp. NPDC058705]|uniref:hypothetical protein n=1 Tax=Nocardia sp. NPDC058705 TaxID=3346609 RepID=UPI0036C2AA3F
MNSYAPRGNSPVQQPARQGLSGLQITDIVVSTAIITIVPIVLGLFTLWMLPWMLVSNDTCRAEPPCNVNPALGRTIMLGSGAISAALAIAVAIFLGLRRWPMFPVAILGQPEYLRPGNTVYQ